MPAALSNAELARAMLANADWGRRLGWDSYSAAIAKLTDAQSPDSTQAAFASALADWQKQEGLFPDGILGPATWGAIQKTLVPRGVLTGLLPKAPPIPRGFDEIVATFGDPRPLMSPDGTISSANQLVWERQTLARGVLPFPIALVDGRGAKTGIVVTSFHAHHLLVALVESIFQEISRAGLDKAITSWGGIYNFRPIRGVSRISLHAFGIAIDLNPENNELGTRGNMNPELILMFKHFGFFWGGDFHGRPDPMHFQYATGY
jgi:hypothetical protein